MAATEGLAAAIKVAMTAEATLLMAREEPMGEAAALSKAASTAAISVAPAAALEASAKVAGTVTTGVAPAAEGTVARMPRYPSLSPRPSLRSRRPCPTRRGGH